MGNMVAGAPAGLGVGTHRCDVAWHMARRTAAKTQGVVVSRRCGMPIHSLPFIVAYV